MKYIFVLSLLTVGYINSVVATKIPQEELHSQKSISKTSPGIKKKTSSKQLSKNDNIALFAMFYQGLINPNTSQKIKIPENVKLSTRNIQLFAKSYDLAQIISRSDVKTWLSRPDFQELTSPPPSLQCTEHKRLRMIVFSEIQKAWNIWQASVTKKL